MDHCHRLTFGGGGYLDCAWELVMGMKGNGMGVNRNSND